MREIISCGPSFNVQENATLTDLHGENERATTEVPLNNCNCSSLAAQWLLDQTVVALGSLQV